MLADILEHRFFAVYLELKTNFEYKSAKEATISYTE